MNRSSFDPTRDYDQEAKDARIDTAPLAHLEYLTAICSHCSQPIRWSEHRKEWLHDTGKMTCTKLVFATPKRGSIEIQKEEVR